jgi:hypothetical protein
MEKNVKKIKFQLERLSHFSIQINNFTSNGSLHVLLQSSVSFVFVSVQLILHRVSILIIRSPIIAAFGADTSRIDLSSSRGERLWNQR